jgi:DNA modification methylase
VVVAVVEFPLAELELWPGNPRRIAPRRLEELKAGLVAEREMLWARPVIARADDRTVFCGNMKVQAARELGWSTIPTALIEISWERAKIWALRDNTHQGEWDQPLLAELLAELASSGVDLALAGFESGELDRLLAGFRPPGDPDEVPPLPTGEPESRVGEIYELGRHRLLCGDCRDPGQLASLMQAEQGLLLLTDPPWGVDYTGKTAAGLTIVNDDAAGLPELLRAAFAAVDGVLAPSTPYYLFAPAGPLGTVFRLAVEDAGWRFRQSLVWAKDLFVLGRSDYHLAHEDILFGYTAGPGRPGRGRHAGSRWYGDNGQSSVMYADRPKRSPDHPTSKPVGLLEALLKNSSRHGDLVLDPFCGSGSTLIACERLGRRCFAVELDPRYADVIRRRYQEQTADG